MRSRFFCSVLRILAIYIHAFDFFFFFFNDPATTEIYTLSLHDALPIYRVLQLDFQRVADRRVEGDFRVRSVEGSLRSEEHTSELQSPMYLVCRLLLEKKKYSSLS